MPRGKKLTWKQVREIRKAHAEGTRTQDLASLFNVDVSCIRGIVAGRSWKEPPPSPLLGRKTGRTPPNKTIVHNPKQEWSEKVRMAKKNKRKIGFLSIDKYNEMYAVYQEVQSPDAVAKRCGVHRDTATKYIEEGDPARNLRPLKDRLIRVMEGAQARQDYTLEMARSEMQRIARVLLVKTAEKVKELQPSDIRPDLLPRLLTDLQKVIERTMGVADATYRVEKDDPFAQWTIEELMAYAQTGIMPQHELLRQSVQTGAAKKKSEDG